MKRGPNQPFSNGIPELLLLSLMRHREMYGYEVVREIKERTDEVISLGEGSIYPSLHALEQAGHLRSRTDEYRGRPRVYYRITAKGRRRLGELSGRWMAINRAVLDFLGEKGEKDEQLEPC